MRLILTLSLLTLLFTGCAKVAWRGILIKEGQILQAQSNKIEAVLTYVKDSTRVPGLYLNLVNNSNEEILVTETGLRLIVNESNLGAKGISWSDYCDSTYRKLELRNVAFSSSPEQQNAKDLEDKRYCDNSKQYGFTFGKIKPNSVSEGFIGFSTKSINSIKSWRTATKLRDEQGVDISQGSIELKITYHNRVEKISIPVKLNWIKAISFDRVGEVDGVYL